MLDHCEVIGRGLNVPLTPSAPSSLQRKRLHHFGGSPFAGQTFRLRALTHERLAWALGGLDCADLEPTHHEQRPMSHP